MKKADMIKELQELLVFLETRDRRTYPNTAIRDAHKIGRAVGVIKRILK